MLHGRNGEGAHELRVLLVLALPEPSTNTGVRAAGPMSEREHSCLALHTTSMIPIESPIGSEGALNLSALLSC